MLPDIDLPDIDHADMPMGPTVDSSSPRPPRHHALRREIAAALLFKALVLIALYWAFFGPSQRRDVSAADVAALFAASAPTQGKH